MTSISIIGSGNMASAIGGPGSQGGNAVEIVGRDAAKAEALVAALGDGATSSSVRTKDRPALVVCQVFGIDGWFLRDRIEARALACRVLQLVDLEREGGRVGGREHLAHVLK